MEFKQKSKFKEERQSQTPPTLGTLLKLVEWSDVWGALQAIYKIPDESKSVYLNAFNEICELESIASGEMKITIKKENDPDCELGVFWDVSGDGRYGLEFLSWNEWKGLEISEEAMSEFSIPEIVTHCLEEMTFWGFSKETVSHETEKIKMSTQERLHAMKNGEGITLEEFEAITAEEN